MSKFKFSPIPKSRLDNAVMGDYNSRAGQRAYDDGAQPIKDDPENRLDFGESWDLARSHSNAESKSRIEDMIPEGAWTSQDADGRWIITRADGTKYYLNPSDLGSKVKRLGASVVSDPLATAGAIAGGVAGGPVGAILGSGVGSLLTTGAEDTIGDYDRVPIDYAKDATSEVISGAVGDAAVTAGRAAIRGSGDLLKRGGRAIEEALRDAKTPETGYLFKSNQYTEDELLKGMDVINKGKDLGIHITPSEGIGRAGDRKAQAMASQNIGGEDIMQKHHETNSERALEAAREMLPKHSSTYDREGMNAVRAGRDELIALRKDKTAPLYEEASKMRLEDVSPVITHLREKLGGIDGGAGYDRMPFGPTLRKIERGLFRMDGGEEIPIGMVEDLGNVRKGVNDLIEEAHRAGRNNEVRELIQVKKRIDEVLDNSSPVMKEANRNFAEYSAPIDDYDEALGRVIKRGENPRANDGYELFNGHNAAQIADFKAKVGSDGMDNLANGYLSKSLADVTTPMNGDIGNIPARWTAKVWNTQEKRDRLKAGMSPESYEALGNMMTVFQAMTSAKHIGSDTQPKLARGKVAGWVWEKLTASKFRSVNRNLSKLLTDPYNKAVFARQAEKIRRASGNIDLPEPMTGGQHGLANASGGAVLSPRDVAEVFGIMFGNQEEVK